MSWKYEIAVLLPENRVLTTLLNHFLQKPIHVGSKPENYDGQHGGYGYGLSNEEIEKVIEFFAAMSKTVGNKLFKNGESHFESEPLTSLAHQKRQVNCCLVRRNQQKFFEQ